MPRISLKRRVEVALEVATREASLFRGVSDDSDSGSVSDSDDDSDDRDLFVGLLDECHSIICSKRYLL